LDIGDKPDDAGASARSSVTTAACVDATDDVEEVVAALANSWVCGTSDAEAGSDAAIEIAGAESARQSVSEVYRSRRICYSSIPVDSTYVDSLPLGFRGTINVG
jgi:hypothetical protein